MVLIDDIVIESYEGYPPTDLKPIFDMVWNAAGFPRSTNFDEDGKWKYQNV